MNVRARLLLLAALSFAPAAQADLTLLGRSTLTALNLPSQGREALYVKGQQLRRDVTERGRSYSYLYDLKKREVAVVDHFQRLIDRHALASAKPAGRSALQLDLKGTGRKHALQDWTCEEYALAASLPGEMGQEKVNLVLVGTVWLERRPAERKELAPFVRAVAAEDFFVGSALPGQPANGQAQGLNEAMRAVLGKGMLCAADIQLKYEGDGPMADLGRRMATKASIVFESVSEAAIEDAVFAPPAGYREVSR